MSSQQVKLLDTLFLTLVIGGLFFILLGTRPLFVPDEGRYAEIIREMVNNHDYVTPYLNYIKYFEKPILFYWLGAAAVKIAGLSIWTIRSVNAVLGILGCLLTYFTSSILYDRKTGLLAALILATSLLYFVMAHMISLDLAVTTFITASLYAFLLATQQTPGSKRRYYFWGFAITAALAVLTKGLIGIVFPSMIISAWIIFTNEWRQLKNIYLPSCLLLFLLIAAPWHILISLRNPEFFYFYFIEQHFLRYATMQVGHYQPIWFFVPVLLIGFFPWIVFLPQAIAAIWHKHNHRKTELFLLLWATLIFIFFSFSKSKLIPYILPAFPPLAIMTACYLVQAKKFLFGIKIGFSVLLLLAILFALTIYSHVHTTPLPDPKSAQLYFNLAALLLILGIFTACIYVFLDVGKAIALVIITTWIFLLVILAGIPAIDTRSVQSLTTQLKPLLKPQDDVITFNQYYQDLPFYLERRISILNWRNELSYGMQYQNTSAWMINDQVFWQRWYSKQRIFVVISHRQLEKLHKNYPEINYYIISHTVDTVLISNQPINSALTTYPLDLLTH